MSPLAVADNLVRIANALVGIVGLSMMIYGGYLYKEWNQANAVNGAAVGVGLLDFALGSFMALIGFRWKCFSQLYCACVGDVRAAVHPFPLHPSPPPPPCPAPTPTRARKRATSLPSLHPRPPTHPTRPRRSARHGHPTLL